MSWIKTINYQEADPQLKKIYDRVKGPEGNIDNVLKIHSLRPHSLVGHMTLYKNVLHNSNNSLPKWYLELLGTYVSHLNKCDYCVKHHHVGLKRLLGDVVKADKLLDAIRDETLPEALEGKYSNGVKYALQLTLEMDKIDKGDIISLRSAGFSDGEILEINQVVSYFNYVNRTVIGLGVNTLGDILGLSPNESDDAANWNHA